MEFPFCYVFQFLQALYVGFLLISIHLNFVSHCRNGIAYSVIVKKKRLYFLLPDIKPLVKARKQA